MHISPIILAAAGAAVLTTALAATPTAHAQDQVAQTSDGPDATRREVDRLFIEMLKDIMNVGASLRYAQEAERIGDIEPAMGVYERLLANDPDQPDIALRLAKLYANVEGWTSVVRVARPILRMPAALKSQREEAEALLEQALDFLRGDPFKFNGFASVGMRYRANANAGPRGDTILSAGVIQPTPDRSDKNADVDYRFIGVVNTRYEFRDERDTQLRTTFSGYASRPVETETADVTVLTARTGPFFQPAPDSLPRMRLRPFAEAGVLIQRDDTLRRSFGGGVEASLGLGPGKFVSGAYTVLSLDYDDTDLSTEGSQRTGTTHQLRFSGRTLLTPQLALDGSVRANFVGAEADNLAYDEATASISTTYTFPEPFALTGDVWRANLGLSGRRRVYDAADDRVAPGEVRKDWEMTLRGTVTAPLVSRNRLSVQLTGTALRQNSNIPNYEYNDQTVGLSLISRF